MIAHPKLQKTKTLKHHAKKLVHKSIDIALKLIGFIGLYFYSILEPFYESGTSHFKNMTNSTPQNPRENHSPRTKPRKRNNFKRLRHWKVEKYPPWKLTRMLVRILIITKIATYSTEDLHLHRTVLNKKLLNLYSILEPFHGPGTGHFKNLTSSLNRREHRKRKKLKNKITEGMLYLLNLRFLPRTIKNVVAKLAEAMTFFVKNIDPPTTSNTAQGPRTHCPICTIPVIGALNYLKQNFKNLTNAIFTAATNYFYIKEHTTNAISTLTTVIIKTVSLLKAPFRRMNFAKRGRSPPRERKKAQDKNIGQYDGNDDPNDWSSYSDDENPPPAPTTYPADSGWFKIPMPETKKGIAYWYNPKRPKDKYSDIKNAPKMKPPEIQKPKEPREEFVEHIEDEEEINITVSETIRTKMVNINVRSAVSDYKKAQIQEGIRKINPDVIAITESWLNKYDQEFRINGYVPIGRQDRPPPRNKEPSNKKRGGGVLVLAKKEVDIKYVHEESLHRDCQVIRFVMDKHTVYVIYRTGKSDVTHKLLTKWLDSEISQLNEKPWIITGDLNLGDLAKVNFDPKLTPVGTDRRRKTPNHMWTELMKKHRISQLVDKPTQKTKLNILDYIFVPENVNIPFIKVDRSAFCTNFDHFAVIFEVDSYYQRTKEEMYKRKETKETWKEFHELLRKTDMMSHIRRLQETLKGQAQVDEISNYIANTLKEIYEQATPLLLTKPPPVGGFLSRTTIRQLKHAKRLHRTLAKTPEDEKKPRILEKLKIINKSNKWLIRQDRIAWEFRRLHLSKERGDNFFRYMSEITRKTKSIGPILNGEGKLRTSDADMAKAFNDFLCDLMKPSSITKNDWDKSYEPKERQLHIEGIKGSETRHPLDTNVTRDQIYEIHRELAPFGYELSVEDITDGYPLGMQARGRKNPPVVITYKDASTKESVNQAAMKANLWNRRTEEDKIVNEETGITGWVKNLARTLGVAIRSILMNLEENKPEKPKTYFTKAYETMKMIEMNTKEIKMAIRFTKRTSAAGPDGLRMAVLSEACSHVLRPLQTLYNAINMSGNIPANFKIARVIMIHKKNSKQEMGNYRPISMENHIAKVWERVLNTRLMIHLNRHNRLTRRQHGFRPKRGCQTNLMEAQEKIIRQSDIHGPVIETWSFDLQKAFDLLDHGKALSLCHKAGINGHVGRSLENWLTKRQQYVQCNKETSDQRTVNRSCIQGSVLGPSMWLIYIQSLLDRLENEKVDHYAYADDVAIVAKISTEEEITNFNRTLEILLKWGTDYEMIWGAHKTQRLAIRYQNCGAGKPPEMFFDGKKIMATEKIESLGMYLDASGVPNAQHERVEHDIKVMRILVAKNYRIRTIEILERLYTTYILPKINYCSTIYHTGKQSHLKGINKELNNFWRLCTTKYKPKKVMGLEEQLIFNDLKYMYKIKHGLTPIDFDDYFTISDIEKATSEKIEPKSYKRGARKAFAMLTFTQRIDKFWNYLPKETRNLKFGPFKEKLKEILTHKKKRRHRQHLLNFGLDTNVMGDPPGIYE